MEMEKGKKKPVPLRIGRSEERRRAPAPRASYSRSMTSSGEGMPPASSAPQGARVIEARGPECVAMAMGGMYLGLFRRG
jgi:hypothetical protein